MSIEEGLAWRLFTRGLSPGQGQAHVALSGDQVLGLKVLEMVSIIA